ncbi:MAG: hypothetical protein M1825_004219 [Sarcosagium campestre]|nr:MAG: hypothetical protein M1825_004219 [Sarcosagium campestre]
MPKSLAKVQNKIAKKRGRSTPLHENSRDSQKLRRADARGDKLARVAAARDKTKQPLLQRIAFFKYAVERNDAELFTLEHVHALIDGFIRRNDEALADLKKERRKGRPASAREDLLQGRMVVEGKEYDTGFCKYLPKLDFSVTRSVWPGLRH